MRRDVILVLTLAVAACGIRMYPAWNNVFTEGGVAFLETDAWYHVRLIENQVRNFPWRVTLDPYAAPGGQFVPIAPLFDTLIATVVVLLHGRAATTLEVERIAALMPPLLGSAAVIVMWLLGRRLFDRRAGLLAAALLAVLPGHFLDRTMLGFVDHHALEALLALTTLLAFARAVERERTRRAALVAGASLGLYLLAWGSGAFLIAIVGVWFVAVVVLSRSTEGVRRVARAIAAACVVAFVLVVSFQDPGMHRYASQVVGLAGLGIAALAIDRVGGRRATVLAVLAALAVTAGLGAAVFARDLLATLFIDIGRLAPDPTRMGVLEARPLFMYAGEWRWAQPWIFFRTGFYVGLAAAVLFAVRVWRERRAEDMLVLTFAAATFAATVGQNRFGYYLVTACALLGGWLAAAILNWGGVPHVGNRNPTARTRLPLARELAVVVVAGVMFAPNLAPRVLLAERASSLPVYWRETMTWLARETPPPFPARGGDANGFYYARYSRDRAEASEYAPAYTVMNWWDQGYWITQRARRVPVANPTQERAPNAAAFYATTDEADAMAILATECVGYVLSDWELPFRKLADGTIMGRFQNVLEWAGETHADYYEIFYRQDGGAWTPVWVFHEPYYRSMAFRLSVLGGAPSTPVAATTVITYIDRVDRNGLRFRELIAEQTYDTFEAAQEAATTLGDAALVVGLDPWRSAFPVDGLASLSPVYEARTAEQKPGETPWVRVFAVREGAGAKCVV